MSKTRLPPPGTETCGCCDGIAVSTPAPVYNRPGLGAIRYRIGEYAQFRQSLQAHLSAPEFPQLARLRTRDADDYTLGLIDAVACAADVLTFYQERIASESWLRTATERVSLQEMGKLIGYRLRAGLAAQTRLAFALEAPPISRSTLAPEPGAFITGIPAALTLAPGLKVQSVPGPGEHAQVFETVEEIVARPAWNAMRAWLSEERHPAIGDTGTWLAGVRTNLKSGDALVLVSQTFLANPEANHWDFRLIDTVSPDPANERTRVTWKRPLERIQPAGTTSVPHIYVLRKRAAVFGHNAPLWSGMNWSFRYEYTRRMAPPYDAPGRFEWPEFVISPEAARVDGGHVDLDGVLGEVAAGSLVALAMGEYHRPDAGAGRLQLYQVAGTAEVSRAEFGMAAKVTRLGLAGPNLAQFYPHVRATSVFAQSERLTLAPYPVTRDVAGDRLPLEVPAQGLAPGRRLVIRGERADGGGQIVHEASISAVAGDRGRTILTINPALPAPLSRATLVVHANVALATHGGTVAQILGAGDASQPFQRFELARLPLTWRSAETGARSELSVRVGDVEWSNKPTLYGAAATERAYTLSVDEQGKTWVVFGDGVRGARPPSGVNNVRARYRQGLGKDGNLGSDRLTQLIDRPLGLKSVSNPLAAEGGADPEPPGQARRAMPLGTRTLGRAVSLLDYEDYAVAFPGVAKARAQVLQLRAGPTIAVTVAGQDGAPLSAGNPIRDALWGSYKAAGDPHVKLALLSYQRSFFRLGLRVKRDPACELQPLLAAVEAALRAHFGFDARALGQQVEQSEVIAVAHSVPGVVAVDLDFLYGGTAPPRQTRRWRHARLLATRMHVRDGVAVAAELLTLDPSPFERLEEMP